MSAARGAFYQSLPRKRMAAGALIRDHRGRVLLLKPHYRATWLIPGGIVEENESPLHACIREVREEIGLDLTAGPLLVVDYTRARADGATESMQLIFDGGVMEDSEAASIALQASEIAAYRFVARSGIGDLVTDRMARRLLAALDALESSRAVYLENQVPMPG